MTGTGWQLAACAPGAARPEGLDALDWMPAAVPGTVAGALHAAGRWSVGEPLDLDGRDWWYRTRIGAAAPGPGEELVLRLAGLATVADVHVDGALVLSSRSMWATHEVPLPDGVGELAIRFHALTPILAERRRPRARWRPRLADGALRFHRTALLGRCPGFSPGPPAVGPWRAVELVRRSGPVLESLRLRPRVEGDDGILAVEAVVRGATAPVKLCFGTHTADLTGGRAELRVPGVTRWWPHTHGVPVLHDVVLSHGDHELARRRVGFRELTWAERPEQDGLALAVNGVPVFARGAVWTTADALTLASTPEALRPDLEAARDAGLNMIRLAGIGIYESPAFHDLCDELGLLVWQDFMFANFDYPIADEDFRAAVTSEARQVLAEIAGRPSLAVLCGNSEVAQQVTMLGLDPALAGGELFEELLPGLAAEAGADVPYLPSAPCGGVLPIDPGAGVANYFGVGGYRRDLDDARRAGVRFASECLAFANVGEDAGIEAEWKRGVARDVGSGWDFDDVRDHYLRLLYDVDPATVRTTDPAWYLDVSRSVSGEVMGEVFGEWRRAASPCRGAIVLWLRDVLPGAGWGLLDVAGRPKAAYHHLRRALAPVALWSTDEGMNGIYLHVANDTPEPLRARLRVALYRGGEQLVEEAERDVAVPAHGALDHGVEELIGRFVDANYTYRFGPAGHDVVVATLDDAAGTPISQTARFPTGRPNHPELPGRVGLEARAQPPAADGTVRVTLSTQRVAWGVRVHGDGLVPDDDVFFVEPARERVITLRPAAGSIPAARPSLRVSALNIAGPVGVSAG